jgi:hypothetical protein
MTIIVMINLLIESEFVEVSGQCKIFLRYRSFFELRKEEKPMWEIPSQLPLPNPTISLP